jgi:hypothetical protein
MKMNIKKFAALFTAAVMVLVLAACGGGSQGGGASSDFTWTREGTFADGNGNYLLVSASEDEEHEGQWAVTAMIGEDAHGWFIKQEGETLHGNLDTEYDDYEGDFIVTISEEGEDGLKMEVEGGETYHFTMEEAPDYIGTLMINVDGLGTIAYGKEGEEVEFEEDFPTQSAAINVEEPTDYVLKAKADEGWKFVKWTKDGEDFSEEPEITVEVTGDVDYRAVFEEE